jgi:hypothetical protein
VTGPLLQLRLDFRPGAEKIPTGQVVVSGPVEGVPCDGERLGDVGGVNREQDSHGHVVPAAPALGFDARAGQRGILLLGEAAFKVSAGAQPLAGAAVAGHAEPDLEARRGDRSQVPAPGMRPR